MKKTIVGAMLAAVYVVGGQALATEPVPPDVKSDASISQDAWSGGMHAGSGNFMQNCMPCHGMEGKGDGPLADSLGGDVTPRDLSNAALLSTRTDEQLFKTIKFGGKATGMTDLMPDWQEAFDDAGIRSIVQYIRTDICKCKYTGK